MLIPVNGQAMVEVVSTGVSHLYDNSTVSVNSAQCIRVLYIASFVYK